MPLLMRCLINFIFVILFFDYKFGLTLCEVARSESVTHAFVRYTLC